MRCVVIAAVGSQRTVQGEGNLYLGPLYAGQQLSFLYMDSGGQADII